MPCKIKIKNLVKSFDTKVVLNNLNLEIEEGESVVIIGGSGSGKTVLIKLIAGLLLPSSGSIIVDGVDIAGFTKQSQTEEYIKKISFLFQLNALFDSYPVWKNIMISKVENEHLSKEEAIEIAKIKVAKVGLNDDILFKMPKEISGGMQKRVALARCLVQNPEIIFFDEPTSGLDPITSVKISNLIKETKNSNGKTMTKISIMHDMECAKIVADRVIFLLNGKIEWSGSPKEMEKSKNENLKEFINKL